MIFIAHQQGHKVSNATVVTDTYFTSRWFLRLLIVGLFGG